MNFSNLKGSERGLALGFFALAFFGLGLPRLFTITATFTLFLEVYDASLIPYTYLGAAALVPMVAFAYLKLEERLPFPRLITLALVLDMAVLVLVRVSLQLGAPGWVVGFAAVWVEVEWSVLSFVFWGLAERSFNVRQAKRLFGVIAAGEPLAIIIGGFMLPLLLVHFGVPDLLWVSVLSVALSVLIATRLARREQPVATAAMPSSVNEGEHRLNSAWHYLRFVFGLAVISIVVHFIVDNAFYERAEFRFPDETELAVFIGRFYAIVGGVTLLCNLFVAGSLLRRHGVRAALLALPAFLAVASLSVLMVDGWFHSVEAVFWLVCAAKLIDESVRWGVFWPSFMVLYQPLKPRQRVRAQTWSEGFFEPMAAAVAAIMLLTLSALVGLGPAGMFAMALAMCFVWVLFTVITQRRYVTMLRRALPERALNPGDFVADSEESIRTLYAGLDSEHAADRIYSLQLISGSAEAIGPACSKLLSDVESIVRREAARQIEQHRPPGLEQHLKACLRQESDTTVKCAFLRALASVAPRENLVLVTGYLQSEKSPLRVAALVALLRHCGIKGALVAGKLLLSAVESRDAGERAIAARVLGHVGVDEFAEPLQRLLDDPEPAVRQAALRAAGAMQAPGLWPRLVQALDDPKTSTAAAAALVSAQEPVLPTLREHLNAAEASRRSRVQLIRIISRIGGAAAGRILFARWLSGEVDDERELLLALQTTGFHSDDQTREWILSRVRYFSARAASVFASIDDLGDADGVKSLVSALEGELDRIREQSFRAITLLDGAGLNDVGWPALRAGGEERIAYAVEVLEGTLPRSERDHALAPLESLIDRQRARVLERTFRPEHLSFNDRLVQIASGSDEVMPVWIRVCALHCIGLNVELLGSRSLDLRAALDDAEPLVRETALWALARTDPQRLDDRLDALARDDAPAIRRLTERIRRGDVDAALTGA